MTDPTPDYLALAERLENFGEVNVHAICSALRIADKTIRELRDERDAEHRANVNLNALVEQATALNDRLREALREALHALVTTNGLTASDGLSAYADALDNGCDANGAWDVFRDQTWKIDHTAVIDRARSILSEKGEAGEAK